MEIDIVFSGGGMKGFALIGALQVLEEKGYKFRRLAGTSAGAIIASLSASGFSSAEIYKIFMHAPRKTFMDSGVKMFPFWKWVGLYWNMGLYKGVVFEQWFENILAAKSVYTFGDLPSDKLKIVVSDVTSNELIVIPSDLKRYKIEPDSFSIARAVRMSISIPYIFRPVKLKNHIFVDGGILSNFPLWVLGDDPSSKVRPLLGVKLISKTKEDKNYGAGNSLELFGSLFETMMNAHDQRYISRRLERNILFIPVNEHVTVDFDMPLSECEDLVDQGRKITEKFLLRWEHKL